MRRSAGERGAVTAEAALVLPVLAAVTLALVWMLGLAVAQMRVTDAAREAARAVARGDPAAEASSAARVAAPGASVHVASGSTTVRVTVEAVVRPPGNLLGHLAAAHVHATAEALLEGARDG
ncbi:TadE family type IV pilus minor pilin [Nocardioides jiangxiensis]|uniref:TadE family type IV pilus minor pilin n=1 Tax=Nocardioides jiangxiensis TaxID=3064524 RepID=A0ABT9B0Y3_9ACTN|nr:TadE family type IV pilus minor pilin [Nocardioides sp. WY-20]MDO7868494.1 TadE family type IV pilus minor pilin [Nocardioides sp. WY-20]